MKKKICILTGTRAEYGLLKPVIKKLEIKDQFDVRVAVTGAHLSPEFGLTYQEIERDGIGIDEKIEILLSADSPASISKSMGLALIGFGDYFERLQPHLLVALGDRYESLAVAIAAMNCRVPIAHLYGGEITEGAIDDSIRHSITKLSYLHFTSTETYRKRVIQLGEHPDRVFCVGALGVENVLSEQLMSKSEVEDIFGRKLDEYAVVTYHPVTLDMNAARVQMEAILNACASNRNLTFIFTKANADMEGRTINQMIDSFVRNNDHAIAVDSLGTNHYLSTLKHSCMVIGNSSSGIVEAPSLGIPTVNIGDRQKGRIQADSIINCEPTSEDIIRAMEEALTDDFRSKAKQVVNPYGDGNTSTRIVRILEGFLDNERPSLKKRFYDLEWSVDEKSGHNSCEKRV